MSTAQAYAVRQQDGQVHPDPRIKVLTIRLNHPKMELPWAKALSTAGGADDGSVLWNMDNLFPPRPAKELETTRLCLINFGRFRSSPSIIKWAEQEGYRPVHPRDCLAAGSIIADMEEKMVPFEGIVTLMPCHKDAGENYVVGVRWDRNCRRSVQLLYWNYGWEETYWFCFKDTQ